MSDFLTKAGFQDLLTKAEIQDLFEKVVSKSNIVWTKLILEQGADKDKANSNGDTPLMIAVKNNHFEIVKYLIEKDCLVDYNHELSHIFYLAFLF
jgi:ankyrin repeat protein